MPETAVSATIRDHVIDVLRASGIDIGVSDGAIIAVTGDGGGECEIVVSQHVVSEAPRTDVHLLSASDDDEARVHIAVFVTADGTETGTALVVSEQTLDELLKSAGDGWRATVNPVITSGDPESQLDVCVAPIAEVGEWVRAELVEMFDDDD